MYETRFPYNKTLEVGSTCLCLYAQRAARALARHFDEVFRPLNLTNGQFSLLMALNRPEPPTVSEVAALLAMDRTTLTALLKPLERRGLIQANPDPADRRRRRIRLTGAGHGLLDQAYPLWREAHATVERQLTDAPGLREELGRLSGTPTPPATRHRGKP
ncbi:MAG: winged helix-turn-helix transcriptional regulator [Ectothiorhodospiraceae bacterium]|nr:winged helix-turn-helix transcriptional regulator [Ectothiorhodospiraceae bacterium]